MIPAYIVSALANHLWQSTAAAAFVGLLVLVLRGNQARIRYALWMIASAKFLIPFSLLMIVGGYLQSAVSAPLAKPAFSKVLEQITTPFSQIPDASTAAPLTAVVRQAAVAHRANPLPAILFSLWACGFLVVVFSWWRKWRTIRCAVRTASYKGLVADVPVLSSPSLLEPGVFGVVKPVPLLPEGITERLTEPQLSAIFAHEMAHVRRRDNLSAAFHMLVEAVLWFHPMVWWIGTRLVEERERACDEAVLQSGNEPQVYAEGILSVCKLYLELPLACVSGVTGSDLKKRIVRIVTKQVTQKLDLSRKLLLSAAGVLAVVSPVVFGLIHVAQVQAQTAAQDITGSWQGTLHAGKDLRTVLKITKGDGGALKSTLYSIDQGGQGIPVTSISLQGSTVKYSIMMIDGSYEGKLSPDGNTMTGTWTQGGHPIPLNLTRATPQTAWVIPEPPPPMKPMAADASPEFEVATIKPSKPDQPGKGFGVRGRHFSTLNTSLNDILMFAYGVQSRQILSGPPWMGTDKFDIAAEPDGEGQPNDKQWKTMIQKLLADRCKLKFHHEQKELSVYALVVGKNGPKLSKSEGDANGLPSLFFRGLGVLPAVNATMADLAGVMQGAVLDRPVVDQTGLKGRFDFTLKWTPDESQFQGMGIKVPPPSNAPDAPPGLFTAIQEELGLKLDATKAPVDVLVIDHVEKPSEN
ncbi:MAG: M56 family metallopeptidase [Acidobacteriota bacterium]|nr:M56 family metallopeptidase [Acidobacteriota bacterium]